MPAGRERRAAVWYRLGRGWVTRSGSHTSLLTLDSWFLVRKLFFEHCATADDDKTSHGDHIGIQNA